MHFTLEVQLAWASVISTIMANVLSQLLHSQLTMCHNNL